MNSRAANSETFSGAQGISAYGTARSTAKGAPLSSDELRKIDAHR
jgi:hypothetical protein